MRFLIFIFACGSTAGATPPPQWPEPVIRVEQRVAGTATTAVSNGISIAPGLLATITGKTAATDRWRAVAASGATALQFLARDEDSGFTLLCRQANEAMPAWTVVTQGEKKPSALPAGAGLTLQSAAPAPARLAGRDHLQAGRLLNTPWLRVHLPAGTWATGTPLTTADGALAGILAAGVPGMPEAARVLPAEALWHFATLWTSRQTLARGELGIRLRHDDTIPCIRECYAALPAERAGIHPGDILLKIGDMEIPDAAAAATACFFLRVDEPVKVSVLRGMETVEVDVTPVSAAHKRTAKLKSE
jgi:hypothetical protein